MNFGIQKVIYRYAKIDFPCRLLLIFIKMELHQAALQEQETAFNHRFRLHKGAFSMNFADGLLVNYIHGDVIFKVEKSEVIA